LQFLCKISEVITDNAENVRKLTDEMLLDKISEIVKEIVQ